MKRRLKSKDDYPEVVRKKKKQLPAVVEPRRLSKLQTKNLKSIMGDSAESLLQMLEGGDTESATTLIHRRLLQTLLDLIPHAETNVRNTKGARGVYQVNSLISSIRELIIDIQSTRDRGAIGVSLVDQVIRPSFLDIGMSVVQEYSSLVSDAKDFMDPADFRAFKDAARKSRQKVAETIQNQFMNVRDETVKFLQR